MGTWLIPREEMTPDQLRAIEFGPQEHRVIFGPPGSGKTQILLHRAKHLCETYSISKDKFHIFVFTKVLKEYIKSALGLLDLPEDCVSTLDSWCRSYYSKHIGRLPMTEEDGRRIPDFSAIRRGVLNKISKNFPLNHMYDFILLDEGQDLDGESFELLKALAKHVTVCLDSKQQIYEKGTSEKDILNRLGLKRRNVHLLGAYRCCPYITSLAAQFIDNLDDRLAFERQTKTYQAEKLVPLLYCATDFEDEKRRLIDVLRGCLVRGEKTAILLPQNRQVYGFAKGLREVGEEVETKENIDFTNSIPKILPYHSAKGLTFDTVLMPRLVPRSFSSIEKDRIMKLMFVGITRATKWVYMSTMEDRDFPALNNIKPLQGKGCLTVQNSLDFAPVTDDNDDGPAGFGDARDDL